MKRHRVLFIESSPEPSFGGSKRVLANILSVLDRDRFLPRVLFARSGPFVDAVRDLGVETDIEPLLIPSSRRAGEARQHSAETIRHRLGVHRHESGEVERNSIREILRGSRSYLYYNVRDRRIARSVAARVSTDTDLLHVNNPMHDDYFWKHVAGRRRIPFATHEHGIWRRPPAAFQKVSRHASAIFCLTDERIALIRQFCGPSAPTVLLPNGVAPERCQPKRTTREVREELGVPEDAALLVTAGHLQRWKGQNIAVEAARRLDEQGVAFVWILCGRVLEPEFEESLIESIRRNGLEDRVRLLGERSDLPDLFAAADLSIHTSVEPEPFGMVLIEAMVVGTASVGPNEGAVPSILANGEAGYLYTPRDGKDLANVLTRVLGDDDSRNRISKVGRERVMQYYTLAAQVRILEETYARILET